ncbi:hypothetical protein H4582DRAFT_1359683 [Lactarius indigo]|nr:hypothetical protein H4582DRAFT_1359683 [Lactarius indigo]
MSMLWSFRLPLELAYPVSATRSQYMPLLTTFQTSPVTLSLPRCVGGVANVRAKGHPTITLLTTCLREPLHRSMRASPTSLAGENVDAHRKLLYESSGIVTLSESSTTNASLAFTAGSSDSQELYLSTAPSNPVRFWRQVQKRVADLKPASKLSDVQVKQ